MTSRVIDVNSVGLVQIVHCSHSNFLGHGPGSQFSVLKAKAAAFSSFTL